MTGPRAQAAGLGVKMRPVRRDCAIAVVLLCVGVWAQIGVGQSVRPSSIVFVDRTAETGLDFVHVNGATGALLLREVIGAGGALFDYDNDGDLELYLVQGGRGQGGKGAVDSTNRESGGKETGGRLFRNDLVVNRDGSRSIRFVDVTAASRIDARGYGIGAATGDF